MRFYRGEIYECGTTGGPRRAMVVELAHGGRTAALRPYDGGPEFTALWWSFAPPENGSARKQKRPPTEAAESFLDEEMA